MTYLLCSLALLSVGSADVVELKNDVVKATIDGSRGLTELAELSAHGASLSFAGDSWNIQVGDQIYIPGPGKAQRLQSQEWVIQKKHTCNNNPCIPSGAVKTNTTEECQAACESRGQDCQEFMFKPSGGHCYLYGTVKQWPRANDDYDCGFRFTPTPPAPELPCALAAFGSSGPMMAMLNYTCGGADVTVAYSLRSGGNFVEKRVSVATKGDTIFFKGAAPFDGIQVALNSEDALDDASWHLQANPFSKDDDNLVIAGFMRWPGASHGAFISLANPWARFSASSTSGCVAGMNHIGDDLVGMPLRNLDTSACKAECDKNSKCKGYTFLEKGCENEQTTACYLKSNTTATQHHESCSCLAKKMHVGADPALAVSAFYKEDYNHSVKLQGKWLDLEPAMIGFTALGKYTNEGLNTGERIAFQRCVESYLLDHEARRDKTVKIMVAWDANDYQIDAGTEDGRTEYKRIIDRASEFGVTHIVYEPRNTLHASRFNTTDGWGWEEALWLGMGELIREGKWDPRDASIPQDILGQLKYANDRNIKLVAYAYPLLPFIKMKEYFVNPENPNALSLAPPEVQAYLIDIMTAFVQKTGIGGFAWDHDIFAGNTTAQKDELKYAQWRGWMNICATLRERFPDIVMDHRQTAHRWGPWYQLAGSYAEPIAGDENPESYGVPIPSLHTDHVAGDNTRKINYIYSTQGLLPPARIPGFIFHQSERTDDDGTHYCTKDEHLCVNNSNTRDFDLLGYKYSLLSTIGTAGLNNVVTMIPARDVAEFTHFPQADVAFIQKWFAWTDSNIGNLQNTQWIPTLNGPQAGNVDGTHSMSNGEGFVFLFNPNMAEMKVKLTVDESLGLTDASSGSVWEVVELYPREGATIATWKYGQHVDVSVLGSDVRVLGLTQKAGVARAAHLTHATMLSAEVSGATSDLELTSVTGPAGQEVIVAAHLGDHLQSIPAAARVSVNGVHCGVTFGPETEVAVQFAGEPVLRVMPVSPSKPPARFAGGWFNTSFVIPNAVKQQLKERDIMYPVPWTHTNASGSCGLPHCVDDSHATWLIPSRLLLNPFLTNRTESMVIDLFIDGKKVELKEAFNSRAAPRKSHTAGAGGHDCFLGFYYDASDVVPAVSHDLAIHLPPIEQGSFQGLFWENVETQYTSVVSSCRLVSEQGATIAYV